jgi:ribosome biogenesis GTPase A
MTIRMQAVKQFRDKFTVTQSVRNWFPGHMFRGMQDIMRLLKNIDCVIEIHDARVPFTGRNARFRSQVSSARPHLLVLNKMDLTDPSLQTHVIDRIRQGEGIDQVMFTNLKSQSGSSNKVSLTDF